MKNAPILSVHLKDVVKGFIMAILTVLATSFGQYLQDGIIPMDWNTWKHELLIGLGAGIAYLLKNFLTDENDKFLKKI